MRIMSRPFKIRTQMFFLAAFVSLLSLMAVGGVVSRFVSQRFEQQLGERAMGIAQSVARIPAIQANLGKQGGERVIQPIADGIRKATGVKFIVVVDMNDIRYSHPVPERIGKHAVGGDHERVLRGQSYLSEAVGTLGPSLRALVPVFHEGKQVGAVSVGVLQLRIRAVLAGIYKHLLGALSLGLIISLMGAAFLAWDIKKVTRGLEPHEIARALKEREGLLESIREGIIAVDRGGKIVLVNGAARRLLRVDAPVLGKPVEDVVPHTRLPDVIRTGEPEFDHEQNLLGTRILTNRLPLKVDGEIVGAIASFRDMTEVRTLAEEVTGVRLYLEALRVQNHEFRNKLQAISGLIQLGETERALRFINEDVEKKDTNLMLIGRKIRNPFVSGILLGKMGRCRELGIHFSVAEDSHCSEKLAVPDQELVVVIGNLLENAMEAVAEVPRDRREVRFRIVEEPGQIEIRVWDSGPGVSSELVRWIFQRGASTKAQTGRPRGYGLYNVRTLVEAMEGNISVKTAPREGAEFVVTLPNGGAVNGKS